MVLKKDRVQTWLDGSEFATFQSIDDASHSAGAIFNASNQDYDFTIKGDDTTPIFQVYGESGGNRIRIRDHLTIGKNEAVSHAQMVDWGLAVTGSSLFYSGGSSLTNINAISAVGDISGTTDLHIDGDTHTTNLILAADGYIMPATSSNTIKMRAQTYDGEMVSIGPDLFQVNMNSVGSVMVTPTSAKFNATNQDQDFSVMTNGGNFSIENNASFDLLALANSGGTSIGGTTSRWPTVNGQASSIPLRTLQVNGITTIYSGGTGNAWSADTTALTVIGDISGATDLYLDGESLIKGNLGVTGGTYSNILSAQTQHIADTLGVSGMTTLGSVGISGQYIKYLNTSNRIFLSSDPATTPSKLYEDWILPDGDHLYFGTGEDLDIYHNGSNSYIDNNNGSLYVTSSVLYLGDTTSETTVQDNLTVNDDLTVNTNTLYVDATNAKIGINTLVPDGLLTLSGGTGFIVYDLEGGTAAFVNGFTRAAFASGADPTNLSPGDQIKFSDGDDTWTYIVDYTSGTYLFITEAYDGVNVTLSNDELLYSNGEAIQLKTYVGASPSFQVSGTSIMSGTTDLLDIFVGSEKAYWSANTDSTISPSGSNATTSVNISGALGISGSTSVLGPLSGAGDISIVGDITMGEYLYHSGDANTYLRFQTDTVNLVAGGQSMIKLDTTVSQDKVQINNSNADIDLNVMGDDGSVILSTDAANNRVGVNTDEPSQALDVVGNINTTGSVNISGTTNINGVISGTTDARFGGNLGVSGNTYWPDNGKAIFGAGNDLSIIHNSVKSIITNTTGELLFENEATDADIRFKGDDDGDTITALTLDMSDAGTAIFNHDISLTDNGQILLGTGSDLKIYHSGSHSIIQDAGAGDLQIKGSIVKIRGTSVSEDCAIFNENGSVELYYDNSKKFETTVDGVTIPENLNISGTTTLTAGGATFYPRPNLYFFANCDAATVGPASDGSFPSTNTTDVSFGVTHNNNTTVFDWTAEELTITRAGLYKFTYNVTLEGGADGTTSNRTGGGVALLRKPSGGSYAVVDGAESYTYNRIANIERNTGTVSIIYNVTADDVFKIVFIRTGAQSASSKLGTITAGTAWTVEAVT